MNSCYTRSTLILGFTFASGVSQVFLCSLNVVGKGNQSWTQRADIRRPLCFALLTALCCWSSGNRNHFSSWSHLLGELISNQVHVLVRQQCYCHWGVVLPICHMFNCICSKRWCSDKSMISLLLQLSCSSSLARAKHKIYQAKRAGSWNHTYHFQHLPLPTLLFCCIHQFAHSGKSSLITSVLTCLKCINGTPEHGNNVSVAHFHLYLTSSPSILQ